MKNSTKLFVGASALVLGANAMAQVTFYEGEGFRGRAFSTNREMQDFSRSGFNDRASSVIVDRGRWEVCEDSRFRGRCVVLRQGSYDSLTRMGIDNRLSSVRPVSNRRRYENESPEPLAAPNYQYRRRPNERVYEAQVNSVRAVMGQSEQHCWGRPGAGEYEPGQPQHRRWNDRRGNRRRSRAPDRTRNRPRYRHGWRSRCRRGHRRQCRS